MSIKVGYMTIPGVKPDGTNPNPKFKRMTKQRTFVTHGKFPEKVKRDLGNTTYTLPYRTQDRYTSDRKPIEIKTITLENEYLIARFTPEFGGKLWSLFDKENNRELLMANSVVQPRNLAIRNAWTSGGIEWNFGSFGHTYFTCDDVFCAIMEKDGQEFLRIYEFERAKECVFQIDFLLPKDSHCLYSHVKITNPNNEDVTTYWWTNVAVPEDGKTRVLSSLENVIAICGENLTYEKLPYLSIMDGDLSYPINASRSFDYFFQPNKKVKTTWEASVNKDGFAFYDRATYPLIYHKMFCWGNHKAGKHWQQYLSDDEHGDYIELQAGIARSQMHDKLFPKNSSFEWTQCFGGTFISPNEIHDSDFHSANIAFGNHIDELISEKSLFDIDKKLKKLAKVKTKKKNIVHYGSGWGALELLREKKVGDINLPKNLCFPKCSITKEQKKWIELLNNGYIKETETKEIPLSWMTSKKWLDLLDESIKTKGGNWLSYLHLGNMLYEYWDISHVTNETLNWEYAKEYEDKAEETWQKSDTIKSNVFAKRNLAILYKVKGDFAKTEKYYDELFSLPESTCDPCFASEYMSFLCETSKFEKALSLYNRLPRKIQKNDSVTLCFAKCALKLNMPEKIKYIFDHDFATIREGETSLSDYWFEYNARLLAKKRNISYEDNEIALLEESEKDFPPPYRIDFRMSYDKKQKYRKTE